MNCEALTPSKMRNTYSARIDCCARLRMCLLIRSIATPYSRPLVNELVSLNITWAFHACGRAALASRTCLITLHPSTTGAKTRHKRLSQTLRCLFLHRSQALFEGTPGIVYCARAKRFPSTADRGGARSSLGDTSNSLGNVLPNPHPADLPHDIKESSRILTPQAQKTMLDNPAYFRTGLGARAERQQEDLHAWINSLR